ncbi:MAG: hypothetical protein NTW04_02075, partial [Elusimicrobia bacterium]|nr:hypothetical protein [Elusimicrobiota bacterium]
MEPPRQITGKIILAGFFIVCALAAFACFESEFLNAIMRKQSVGAVIFSDPPIFINYNISKMKAEVFFTGPAGKGDYVKNTADIMEGIAVKPPSVYFAPAEKWERAALWSGVISMLENWRKTPSHFARYVYSYIKARLDGRCNISVWEFIAITMELTRLGPGDFYVFRERKGKTPPAVSQTQAITSAPFKIEILNATGKKGAALKITRMIRSKTFSSGLIVDVLRYDNYPGVEKENKVFDYTG